MKRSTLLKSFTLLALAASTSTAFAADGTRASRPCTGNEEWSFGSSVPSSLRSGFEEMLEGKNAPAVAYGQAAALEKSGPSVEARIFGAYWKNRALLMANLDHAAADGMAAIAAATPQRETYGVQAAALACLNQLRLKHPGLEMPRSVAVQVPSYLRLASESEDRDTASIYALSLFKDLIVNKAPAASVNTTLAVLKGSGAPEAFAKGLYHASRNEHAQTIAALERWLKGPRPLLSTPSLLQKEVPHARLLLARAYYALGKYDAASEQYGWIDGKSNEIAEALSERSWANLMAGRYADAIGASSNLEAGSLRKTYAPEAAMVMAMSLNELCQYPDSLRAVKLLNREYGPSLQWLREWNKRPNASLYSLALEYLKGQDNGVPARIASEWIRNNRFIALQEEISSLFRETDAANEFRKSVAEAREKLNEKARDLAADANVGVREDRGVLRVFAPNAPAELQAKIKAYNGLGEAFAEWEDHAAARARGLTELQKEMVARINRELAIRTQRMLAQLEDVRQNTQLIEVEIYQGASHDLIWLNAHPDFRDKTDATKIASQIGSAGQVLKFGSIDPKQLENNPKMELWEDEIGAFKAGLNDNCSRKDKYLALSKKVGRT